MRDSTIFYRSFYEAIKELDSVTQAQVYNAIFEYSLNFREVELDGLAKTIFTLIKPQLQANINKYHNGKNPKSKQEKSKTEAKDKQNESKTEANVNVNVNVNEKVNNIEERKLKFADTLKPFLPTYGKDMLNDFYKYWTEPNKSNSKFKMELEKTWSLDRRIETWAKNDKSFSKVKVVEPERDEYGFIKKKSVMES